MPEGAIHLGEAPTNYQFRMDTTSSYTTTGGQDLTATARLQITWGLPYEAGVTGIEVRLENKYLSGVESHVITLTTPWDDPLEIMGSGWIEPDFLIDIDDLELSRTGACAWSLDFSELRFYVDAGLELTIGAQSESGSGFDLRKDSVRIICSTMEGVSITDCALGQSEGTGPSESCGSFDSAATHEHESHIAAEGGWRWWDGDSWEEDEVSVDPPELPTDPPTDCICTPDIPWPIEDEESWDLKLAAKYIDELEKTFIDTFECECPIDGGFREVGDYRRNWHVEKTRTEINAIPETSGIEDHAKLIVRTCAFDIEDRTEETTEEMVTLCEQFVEVDYSAREQHCRYTINGVPCLEFPFPADNSCQPAFPTYEDFQCCVQTSGYVLWPTLPSCGGTPGECISADVSDSWRHVRAYIEDGEVFVGLTGNRTPFNYSHVATGITAECVCIRWARDTKEQALELLTEETEEIFWRSSLDEGASWSMPTTIATGKTPAFVVSRNLLRYIYWIDGTTIKGQIRDSTFTVVVSTFTAVASGVDEDGGLAADEFFSGGGGHGIELNYRSGGSVTSVTSPDGQNFS